MSLDLSSDYNKAKNKINAAKTYIDAKKQYIQATKKAAQDSFEKEKSEVTETINELKEQKKRFERNVKNQLDQLLDISNITGGKGSNTIDYVKRLFLKTLSKIEPQIQEILLKEISKVVGCDQQQTFPSSGGIIPSIYIKVKSIDLGRLLKIDPNSNTGKCLYERKNIVVNDRPFPMNRELYNRIQFVNTSYNDQYGTFYLGKSGQPLFDITYVETNNLGETGPWYKIDLVNRGGNFQIFEFLVDYYKTIKVFEFHSVIASIMEQLSGVISINVKAGEYQIGDVSKFQKIIQRILGLCFDNVKEIDVSGVSKIAELDGVDNSFFEFTTNDLRSIEERVSDIRNGVVKFLECDYVEVPVDHDSIINSINNLLFVKDSEIIKSVDEILNSLNVDPQYNGVKFELAINVNFVKMINVGLVTSLLSPKVLLPIYIAFKGLGKNFVDLINSFMDFVKEVSQLVINLTSKIGALFIKELFELIRKDIKNLIQQIVLDIQKEKSDKKVLMVLKLIQLLIVVAEIINDWRRCKSVVDEILWLLKIVVPNSGTIPLPLLFASSLLDGYSETRAFIGTIEELQKLGVPTGNMPDGSPNLELLSRLSQMKAMANEDAENGKVEIAIPPLTITPAGLTIPAPASGKKF